MDQRKLTQPVPTVRVIVTGVDGKILILRRALHSTCGGLWCLPGGKVDYGDTIEEAVARELQEESGLCAVDLSFLFYQDSLPTAPGLMHCINFYFRCRANGELKLNDESVEFAWIGQDDLSRYVIAFRNDEALVRFWKERDNG